MLCNLYRIFDWVLINSIIASFQCVIYQFFIFQSWVSRFPNMWGRRELPKKSGLPESAGRQRARAFSPGCTLSQGSTCTSPGPWQPLPECLCPSQAQEAQRWWLHSGSPSAERCGICRVPETQGELTYMRTKGAEEKVGLGHLVSFIKY